MLHSPHLTRCALLVALGIPSLATAAPPAAEQRAAVVGQPDSLLVQPEALTLTGPRAMTQLVVTGKYADGSVRDLTHVCDIANPEGVAQISAAFVTPLKNGAG